MPLQQWLVTCCVCVIACTAVAQSPPSDLALKQNALREELRACSFRILFESYRGDTWDIFSVAADGSGLKNLTRTPDMDELYPKASPDGTRIAFIAEEMREGERKRSVACMDADGKNRVTIADNATMPFWSPDGTTVAYAGPGKAAFSRDAYANQGLFFHDMTTAKVTRHPNKEISGLLTPCWSADGNWVVASVIRSMGFGESICALHVHSDKVVELAQSRSEPDDLYQCRPDLSTTGEQVAWGKGNTKHKDYFYIEVADVDLTVDEPSVSGKRFVRTVLFPQQTYHVDWSPDAQYIVYSQGGMGSRMQPAGYVVGKKALGWDLYVVKVSEPDVVVRLTHDGLSNKEPDWLYVAGEE